jgi:hypothetical protein
MGIWDSWTREAPNYTHGMPTPGSTLQPNEHYVEVTLRRMSGVAARVGFKKLYGTVHSDAGTQHASGELASVAKLIAPPQLANVTPSDFARALVINQPLFGPTPYRGGLIKLNVALLAIKSADLLGPYLDLLVGVGAAAGVPFVNVAKEITPILRRGVDVLTQSGGSSSLEIYVVSNVEARTGAFVVMRTDKAKVRLEDLRVAADFTVSHAKGMDISRYPYITVTIDATANRPDWRAVPALRTAYDDLAGHLEHDRPQQAGEALTTFRRIALLSDDLIKSDAEKIVADAKKLHDDLIGATLTSGGDRAIVPTFDEFDPFARA